MVGKYTFPNNSDCFDRFVWLMDILLTQFKNACFTFEFINLTVGDCGSRFNFC